MIADAPNRVWAVDFQFDVTTDGRPIKVVSIIDEHTRECLGGMVERSITGEHPIAELDRLAGARGTYPAILRPMNQFSVDSVRAYELMVQQWHNTNTPGRAIAERIIDVCTGG